MNVFLYLKSSPLDDKTQTRLIARNIVPVAVDSFDQVQMIEVMPSLSTEDMNVITQAAIAAIQTSTTGYDARTAFGVELAKRLAKPAQPTKKP